MVKILLTIVPIYYVCTNPYHLINFYKYMFLKMRDEKEERKKQARSNKQTRLSNTCMITHMHIIRNTS